jgi:hypothetical protein
VVISGTDALGDRIIAQRRGRFQAHVAATRKSHSSIEHRADGGICATSNERTPDAVRAAG